MFREDADRDVFVEILRSRLARGKLRSRRFREAAAAVDVEVSSYCLMTTHFHLIVWQFANEALRRLMQSVLHTYVLAYNRKYNLKGPMFKGPFRCNPITNNKQLRYTTAYVHANHPEGPSYRYSSHRAFIDDHERPGWLTTARALAAFDDYPDYMRDHATRAALNDRFFSAVGSNQ